MDGWMDGWMKGWRWSCLDSLAHWNSTAHSVFTTQWPPLKVKQSAPWCNESSSSCCQPREAFCRTVHTAERLQGTLKFFLACLLVLTTTAYSIARFYVRCPLQRQLMRLRQFCCAFLSLYFPVQSFYLLIKGVSQKKMLYTCKWEYLARGKKAVFLV